MKKILMLVLSLSMGLVYAQNDPVILTIEDDTVRLSEFEYVYNKNRDNKYAEEKTPEEYMELFVNFKLKVHKAEALGLDTTPQFQSELRGYRGRATSCRTSAARPRQAESRPHARCSRT